MSREIRRVKPGWWHPVAPTRRWEYGRLEMIEDHVPLFDGYDSAYEQALAEWRKERDELDAQAHADGRTFSQSELTDAIGTQPNAKDYMPTWTAAEATAYQVYETVSEGTPISPVLLTREALIVWLMFDGDGMGIGGRRLRLSREQAERFATDEYAPTMIGIENRPDAGLYPGVTAPLRGKAVG